MPLTAPHRNGATAMPIFAGLATLAHIVTDSAVLNLAYAYDTYRYPTVTEATHSESDVWSAYSEAMRVFDAACDAYALALVELIPLHTQSYEPAYAGYVCGTCTLHTLTTAPMGVYGYAPADALASEYCEWYSTDHVLNAVYGIGFGA